MPSHKAPLPPIHLWQNAIPRCYSLCTTKPTGTRVSRIIQTGQRDTHFAKSKSFSLEAMSLLLALTISKPPRSALSLCQEPRCSELPRKQDLMVPLTHRAPLRGCKPNKQAEAMGVGSSIAMACSGVSCTLCFLAISSQWIRVLSQHGPLNRAKHKLTIKVLAPTTVRDAHSLTQTSLKPAFQVYRKRSFSTDWNVSFSPNR